MNKLALLIPVFLLLAMTEWWLTRKSRPEQFSKENTLLNICIGAIDRILSLGSFALFIYVLQLVYDNFRLWTPEPTWYHWVLAYFAVDFVSYWYHRFSHRIAILWCAHVTHHSSGHFNLTNGFRTSPFQGLYRIPFWIILPILGFSPTVLIITFVASGLYDFFLHTQSFPKVRWLEFVLITPSLHKVHHGKNDVYIDKNYGATFVIWDRMFGTFQDETETVHYGILSKDYRDGDPVDAIFHHYKYLWVLMKATTSWKNKLKVLLMPPDWMPEDISEPVDLPIGAFPVPGRWELVYGVFQFVLSSVGIIAILIGQESLSLFHFILYAGFFLMGMISATRILNRRATRHFRLNEFFRNLLFSLVFGSVFVFSDHALTDFFGMVLTIIYAMWSWGLLVSGKKALREKSVP